MNSNKAQIRNFLCPICRQIRSICFIRDPIPIHDVGFGHGFFDSKVRFIFFISFQLFFLFIALSSSCCWDFHTMISRFGYAETRMLIFETGLFYYQIILCSSVSVEFFWFEIFADELSENSLTYRNNFFLSCVMFRRRVYDGIIFEIRCQIAEIADAD